MDRVDAAENPPRMPKFDNFLAPRAGAAFPAGFAFRLPPQAKGPLLPRRRGEWERGSCCAESEEGGPAQVFYAAYEHMGSLLGTEQLAVVSPLFSVSLRFEPHTHSRAL